LTTAAAPIPQPPIPQPKAKFRTIAPSIAFPMFLGMVGETIVATALPVIAASLGNVEQVTWVVVAYLIAMAITAPVYGRLGDAFGRRHMMVVALSISFVGSILCALSTSIGMLIAARVFQGIGGGGLVSLSQALVSQSVQPRDRMRFHGYIAAFGFSCSALGPVLGGLLTDSLGWQSVFLFNLPFAFMGILLVFRVPARTTPFEPFRFDFPGMILFTVFVSSLLILVEEVRRPADTRPVMAVGLAAMMLIGLALLIRREFRATMPLFPPVLIRNPNIWRGYGMAICHGGYFVALLSMVPIYLRVVYGLSASEIGLVMLPLAAGIGIGTFTTGQIASRTGHAAIFPSVGLIVTSAMLIVLGLLEPLPVAILSPYLGIVSLATGTVMAVVQATVQSESGGKLLGTATSGVSLCRALGAAIGTALAGSLLFATLAASGMEISTDLQAMLQGSDAALESLSAETQATIRDNVAFAFRGVFLLIASYAVIGCALAWTIPRRRL
jgi:MFS family permease